MDSRVQSLLCMLKLEDRFEPIGLIEEKMYSIDFGQSDMILRSERKKAISYLCRITK